MPTLSGMKHKTDNNRVLPVLSEMSARLRHARRMSGLNQTSVCVRMHRPRSRVSSFENGRVIPSDEELELLARIYDVPLRWLRGSEDGSNSVPDHMPADMMGKCLLDSDTYDRIMQAETLSDLRGVLPWTSTGFRTVVASPMTSECQVVPWSEGAAKQQAVDEKVRGLIADSLCGADETRESREHPVAFDRALESAISCAIRTGDEELARNSMDWAPYFLPLVALSREEDVEWLPYHEALDRAFSLMREFQHTFPGLVLEWRRRHDDPTR